MSRRRFENLDQDRQEKLLNSAAAEFSARGYEGASLNRILELSGMSKSSLYYYFDDKADLFTSLVERSVAFLFKAVGGLDLDALTAETFWDELEALFRRAVRVMNGDAWYMRLGRMFYRLRGEARSAGPTDRAFEAAARWVAAIIERGQALGVVRMDLPMSLLVDCAMGVGEALDRWVLAHWDELDEPARLRMAAEQTDLFKRFLQP